VCPACTGCAYEPVKGVPCLMLDAPSRACAGTGRRAIEAKHNLLQLVADMFESLYSKSAHAASQTMKRLELEMDL